MNLVSVCTSLYNNQIKVISLEIGHPTNLTTFRLDDNELHAEDIEEYKELDCDIKFIWGRLSLLCSAGCRWGIRASTVSDTEETVMALIQVLQNNNAHGRGNNLRKSAGIKFVFPS